MNAERDRDSLLERALKREMSAEREAPAGDACLDPETLAAWMDGGLDAHSLALAEAHASSCARCQSLVATLVRTLPAEPAAAPAGMRLWRWWFAPVAATAAAVTLWMVVPPQPVTAPDQAELKTFASAEASVDPVTPAPAPAPAATFGTPQSSAAQVGQRVRERAEAPASPVAPARADAARRGLAEPEVLEPKAEAPQLRDNAAEGRLTAAAPPAATGANRAQQDRDDFTARAAPSPNVIWRVGRAGLVQLATDGRTFVRIAFPEAVDLTAVTATDERQAKVTTADGRTFQTADGGHTWQRP